MGGMRSLMTCSWAKGLAFSFSDYLDSGLLGIWGSANQCLAGRQVQAVWSV
ncbi:hypothetical protein I79_018515 [Cricetulus griseus]|uniref:Uncharacterized protein n=1 Tax=Cricetulus griseus TaxID=10029 RepID=G3I4X4_CRIGR|nr:hypothetical protein I79_018515 [Cricetulus griseus]